MEKWHVPQQHFFPRTFALSGGSFFIDRKGANTFKEEHSSV
jgi:hypothetical protein